MTARTGWYLLAFLDELATELTPLDLAGRALVAVRDGDDVRVYDGRCPHRGAHLGYGGTLDRGCVVCPFHGRSVRLGGSGRLGVAEHHVVQAGDAVFLRLGSDPGVDRGFELALKEAASTHRIVGATTVTADVPAEMVVENAFDVDHFLAVHKVPRMHGMDVQLGEHGELRIDGELRTATSPWAGADEREAARGRGAAAGAMSYDTASRFSARAFSPHVVLTELGGSVVLTGAVPLTAGRCRARVAVGMPAGQERALPALIAGAGKALAEDVVVWDHLDTAGPQLLDARDTAVLAFRQFCTEFTPLDRHTRPDVPAGPPSDGRQRP